MHEIYPLIQETEFPDFYRGKLDTLQINLGYKCNQSCIHCHVNAGPKRKEMMSIQTMKEILKFIKTNKIKIIDITGGAPELNPHFKFLVNNAKKLNCHVIDRCNLTILLELKNQKLANYLAENNIEIIASLPCYQEENVDNQRGKGVFKQSIEALKILNSLGYGTKKDLLLNLVFNPQGTQLPPKQSELESQYKEKLNQKYGIHFNKLYTITNMPIARFGSTLISKGVFKEYMSLLKKSFSHAALNNVMCKKLLSVDYQGYLYDCDFNQMLNIGLTKNKKKHISTLNEGVLDGQKINVADHCYGCTAGSGSSCTGTLT